MANKNQTTEQNSENLFIGVPNEDMPEELNDEKSGTSSKWWPTKGDSSSVTQLKKTRKKQKADANINTNTTATDELNNFKPMPIVGKLPWKTQHFIATFIMIMSLIALLFSASSAIKEMYSKNGDADDTAVSILNQAAYNSLVKKDIPPNEVINSSMQRIKLINDEQINADIAILAKGLGNAQTNQLVFTSASNIEENLANNLSIMGEAWRTAGNSGGWASPEAVNFSQALAEIRHIADTASAIKNGQPRVIDNRFVNARQNVEQSIRMFAQSNTKEDYVTAAWRVLAKAWTEISPDLDVIIGNRQHWNDTVNAIAVIPSLQNKVLRSGNRLFSKTKQAQNMGKSFIPVMLIISASLTSLSMMFLIWIGWKQQRWNSLNNLVGEEEISKGIDRLIYRLRKYNNNQNISISSSMPVLSPLASSIESVLDNNKLTYNILSERTQEILKESIDSSEATGKIVNFIRQNFSSKGQEEKSQMILHITSAMQDILNEMNGVVSLINESSADKEEESIAKSVELVTHIEENINNQNNRFERINNDASSLNEMVKTINQESDRLAVLAIQAAIHAARAGESGNSFKVISEKLKDLSEKIASSSRRATLNSENMLSDVKSVIEIKDELIKNTLSIQGHQNNLQETSISKNQKTEYLLNVLSNIHKKTESQEKILDKLSKKAVEELTYTTEFEEIVQTAAEKASSLASKAVHIEQLVADKNK